LDLGNSIECREPVEKIECPVITENRSVSLRRKEAESKVEVKLERKKAVVERCELAALLTREQYQAGGRVAGEEESCTPSTSSLGSLATSSLGSLAAPTTGSRAARRGRSLNSGFLGLQALIPGLGAAKVSKAGQLVRAADHISGLKTESERINEEVASLRRSVSELQAEIDLLQSGLPAGSASSAVPSAAGSLHTMFSRHVEDCTRHNWKYWVFSRLLEPLLDTYDRNVSSGSVADLGRTCSSWLDQHVTLTHLRPLATTALTSIGVESNILTEPDKLPAECLQSAIRAKPR